MLTFNVKIFCYFHSSDNQTCFFFVVDRNIIIKIYGNYSTTLEETITKNISQHIQFF